MDRMKATTTMAVFALFSGALAARTDQTVKAQLQGFNEVPAISSSGFGEFTAKLRGEDAIDFELTYVDLEAPALFAHIHLGQRNVNGGVSVFLCGGGGRPACPTISGSVSGTIIAADVIGPAGQGIAPGEFSELMAAIRSGVTYANVHTTKHPGGEIRGQIHDEDERR